MLNNKRSKTLKAQQARQVKKLLTLKWSMQSLKKWKKTKETVVSLQLQVVSTSSGANDFCATNYTLMTHSKDYLLKTIE